MKTLDILSDDDFGVFEGIYIDITGRPLDRDEIIQTFSSEGSLTVVSGWSGTGKDLLVRSVHTSLRPQGNLVEARSSEYCLDISESLLWGSEPGAYTGATKRVGLVGQAKNGTLFLNELHQVPLHMQGKFHSFLQFRRYRPVGAVGDESFEGGHIVVGVQPVLRSLVEQGDFLEDLEYRLVCGGEVIGCKTVNSLPEKIVPFVEYFRKHQDRPCCFDDKTKEHLSRLTWKNNLREIDGFVQMCSRRYPNKLAPFDAVKKITDFLGSCGRHPNGEVDSLQRFAEWCLARGEFKKVVDLVKREIVHLGLAKYRTQNELAQCLGVSESEICRYRNRFSIEKAA